MHHPVRLAAQGDSLCLCELLFVSPCTPSSTTIELPMAGPDLLSAGPCSEKCGGPFPRKNWRPFFCSSLSFTRESSIISGIQKICRSFFGARVRPNMLNMPKSAAVHWRLTHPHVTAWNWTYKSDIVVVSFLGNPCVTWMAPSPPIDNIWAMMFVWR